MPKPKEPFVSVVITVYNAAKTMSKCLDSLLLVDYPKDCFEIIIVDARSRDGTQDIVKKYAKANPQPAIHLFEKEGYIGAGRNEGIARAKGEFIAVTDADMEVSPGWVREHLAAFEDDVGATGGPNNIAERGAMTDAISCLDIHGPSNDVVPMRGYNIYSEAFKTDSFLYANVCRNSFFRKSVLDKVGGFDERLIATEDPELNQRIIKAGYRLKYTPGAVVYHHHRSSLKSFHRQQKHYAFGQAIANKLHPEMFGIVQIAPLMAAIGLLVFTLMGLIIPIMLFLVVGVLLLYLLAITGYGVKCARKKGNYLLILTIPLVVVPWHAAWVFGYIKGLRMRKYIISHNTIEALDRHSD